MDISAAPDGEGLEPRAKLPVCCGHGPGEEETLEKTWDSLTSVEGEGGEEWHVSEKGFWIGRDIEMRDGQMGEMGETGIAEDGF